MDLNSTIPAVLEPFVNTVTGFMSIIQVMVGGIFGLYLILILMRWMEARQLKSIMSGVLDELKALNTKVDMIEKSIIEKVSDKVVSVLTPGESGKVPGKTPENLDTISENVSEDISKVPEKRKARKSDKKNIN